MDLANVASSGNYEQVRSLLSSGADVDRPSSQGFLPICNAAFWGYANIVELLLQKGADINLANSGTGWTACHCAAFQDHGKVMMKLMEHGPDLTMKDSEGRTAANFASALDAIWPFFAAEGCKRTSKADLIRLGVIRKVPDQEFSKSPSTRTNQLPHYSRPGSAYIMRDPSLKSLSGDQNKNAAALMGDILCLEEEPADGLTSRDAPKFSIWKN